MSKVAPRLRLNLEAMNIAYEIKHHRPTSTASETAEAAHVPGHQVVKAVLLRDSSGPLLAVLASTQHVDLELLNGALKRKLVLVPEPEINRVFFDCSIGALPPTGTVYGVDMVVDSSLEGLDDVYIEAGDHQHLLRIKGSDFERLMRLATRVNFAVAGPVHAAEPAAAPVAEPAHEPVDTAPVETGSAETVPSETASGEEAPAGPKKPARAKGERKASKG